MIIFFEEKILTRQILNLFGKYTTLSPNIFKGNIASLNIFQFVCIFIEEKVTTIFHPF